MGVVVNFSYASWIARYPEFDPENSNSVQPVSSPLATQYFNEATVYQANNGAGPIRDATLALTLMNMLVAHIASLNTANANGTPAPNIVGRISNASEGSVSIGTDNQYPPGSPQWFQQTKYGAAWWAGTAQFRTMRNVVGPATVPAFGGAYGRSCFGGSIGRGCGRGCSF